MPLGLFGDTPFDEARLELATGDVCVFMTDGVTESFDERSPVRALFAGIVRGRPRPATDICDAIMARAGDGHGPQDVDDWTDDRTVVVVRAV